MVIVEPFHKHRTKKRKRCELSLSYGTVSLLGDDNRCVNPTTDPVNFVRLNLREINLDDDGYDDHKGERSAIELTGEEAKDLAERILRLIERGEF